MIEPRFGIFNTKLQAFASTDVDWNGVVDEFTLKFPFRASAEAWLRQYRDGFDPETTIIKELPETIPASTHKS